MEYCKEYPSPIGMIRILSDGNAVTGLLLETQQQSATKSFCGDNIRVLGDAANWLTAYFNGKTPKHSLLPLNPKGTPFQQSVWKLLLEIPYGETVTYGQIANRIATEHKLKRMSAQAVGQAIGANPISIIIPCHRVIGANGKLTGYAGGLETKDWLLHHEHSTVL